MEFEWDEPKRLSNIDKHDIDFRVARAAFKDRGRIVYQSGIGHPEVRLVLVGRVAGAMVTVITPSEVVRHASFARGPRGGRSERVMSGKEAEVERVVRFVADLDDGTYIIETADGVLERRRDQTDWSRLRALTDEDIEAATAADPEWDGLRDIDWETVEVQRPAARAAVKVDRDIVADFQALHLDYEDRINAVLRAHLTEQRKAS